jgi:RNA polymerase sigma-B factor
VANIGLLKAIDRFVPNFGVPFGAYATPTMMGELRRHFRDYTWSVHVPRQTKDFRASVAVAINDLTAPLGRQPHVSEIAAYLNVSHEEVANVLEANNAYRSCSFEQSGMDRASVTDPSCDGVLDRELIADLLHHLPPRQQMILYLQFFEQLSQEEIAEKIGISQVHVGRLISASLKFLRDRVEREIAGSK